MAKGAWSAAGGDLHQRQLDLLDLGVPLLWWHASHDKAMG